VFKYKLDSQGRLLKYKARICVRGDLQTTNQDTYAATLAARVFRCLMAVTAAKDLETRQYDAINAFVNSEIDEDIYCEPPDGIPFPAGYILKLDRALYGLRQSPALWQKHVTNTFTVLGLHSVPGINCLFMNEWMTLFFFVDDIAIIFDKRHTDKVNDFERRLLSTYKMHAMGELEWFLSIRISRDRENKRLWLSQDAYIEKLISRFNVESDNGKWPHTPLPNEQLLPFDGQASKQDIYRYQQLVGSLNYAAVITRPDVAFAATKLSEHLRNPSPRHLELGMRTIRYLAGTKHLSICYDGQPATNKSTCSAYSDSSYADDTQTRQSSQGYVFLLFGGAVDWTANKQRTVTTSTTEAELLSLSFAAKEIQWWDRFLQSTPSRI